MDDEGAKIILAGQAKLPDPFDFTDPSFKDHLVGDRKEKVRRSMNNQSIDPYFRISQLGGLSGVNLLVNNENVFEAFVPVIAGLA